LKAVAIVEVGGSRSYKIAYSFGLVGDASGAIVSGLRTIRKLCWCGGTELLIQTAQQSHGSRARRLPHLRGTRNDSPGAQHNDAGTGKLSSNGAERSVPLATGQAQIHESDVRAMAPEFCQSLLGIAWMGEQEHIWMRVRIRLNPSRKTGWSSTLRMRMGLGCTITIPCNCNAWLD